MQSDVNEFLEKNITPLKIKCIIYNRFRNKPFPPTQHKSQLKDQNKNNKLKPIIIFTFLFWPHSKRKYFCLYRCFLLLSAWEWVPVDVAVQDRQSWHNLNRCTLHINFSHWETAHKRTVRFLHPDQWHFLGLVAIVNLRWMSLVFKTELSAQLEQMLKLRFY